LVRLTSINVDLAVNRLAPFAEECDLLLVLPPYASTDKPSLGLHLLQACCSQHGLKVIVLYVNLTWAECLGNETYTAVCRSFGSELVGERCFSFAAFGLDGFRKGSVRSQSAYKRSVRELRLPSDMDWPHLAERAAAWCDKVSEILVRNNPLAIGCSTMFEQSCASIALLKRVKQLRPQIVTIMGGPNCEGGMANGMATIANGVDHIFSGESEKTLTDFMLQLRSGKRNTARIIYGNPCQDLDSLPCPDFTDFFRQRSAVLQISPKQSAKDCWLSYETSRGCWWGQKSQCTFCGINGTGIGYREKSADRVLGDLALLRRRHGVAKVCMLDNIMPHRYFTTLLPRLEEECHGLHVFYEQKSNLSLTKVVALKRAGINVIQPGIEALHDDLLALMKKGVTASQNIALLRYARCVDLAVNWSLLYGFPGDRASWYQDTLRILPLLRHLPPPTGVFPLSIDRFSPYFDDPERYAIRNIRPIDGYMELFPEGADVASTAYYFTAQYASESLIQRELITEIVAEVARWRRAWRSRRTPPALAVVPVQEGAYMLVDSRGGRAHPECELINEFQAALAVTGIAAAEEQQLLNWSLDRGLVFFHNGRIIPLAVAEIRVFELLQERTFNRMRRRS
jgi:ribosomal peptide maturation radical SAM protein 1